MSKTCLVSIIPAIFGFDPLLTHTLSLGGCGQAFAVIIVSPEFQGKNKLMRSRMVNNQLKQEIAAIHAFTQKNFTPEEFETQRANYNV